MKNKTIWLICAIILISSNAFADYIYLKSGLIVRGKIVRITNNDVEYDPQGEVQFAIYPKKDVKKVVFSNGEEIIIDEKKTGTIEYDDDNSTEEETASGRRQYPVLGASIGTPSAINLVAGYYFRYLGFHLSGFYLSENYHGIQLNCMIKIHESAGVLHGISIIGNFVHFNFFDPMEFLSYGAVYNLNLRGFFLEFGIAVVKKTDASKEISSPQAMAQIGYVHRFY
ncbi:MAG: hypothetical protein GY754_08485 [bacterium]|nr:hypothetical protein [bacterium]